MKQLFCILFTLSTLSASADSVSTPQATFLNKTMRTASCIPDSFKNPTQILKTHGVSTKDLTPEYIQYIADILSLMSDLSGEDLQIFNGTIVSYNNNISGFGRQTTGPIELSSTGVKNRAVYVHEFGHVVGNATTDQGTTFYIDYNNSVTTPCNITSYSKVNHSYGRRNEEFAEAMTVYLLAPNMLLNHGPSCKQAYDFFRANLFSAKDHHCEEI